MRARSESGGGSFWLGSPSQDVLPSRTGGQTSRWAHLSPLSLHAAHLVAGITFTQFMSLLLGQVYGLSGNEVKDSVFQLYEEVQFSKEMKENSSFSRPSIKKEFLLQVASQAQLGLGALGNYTLGRGT